MIPLMCCSLKLCTSTATWPISGASALDKSSIFPWLWLLHEETACKCFIWGQRLKKEKEEFRHPCLNRSILFNGQGRKRQWNKYISLNNIVKLVLGSILWYTIRYNCTLLLLWLIRCSVLVGVQYYPIKHTTLINDQFGMYKKYPKTKWKHWLSNQIHAEMFCLKLH